MLKNKDVYVQCSPAIFCRNMYVTLTGIYLPRLKLKLTTLTMLGIHKITH